MKQYITIAALMVAGIVQASVVENYQIGGRPAPRDDGWQTAVADSLIVNGGVTNGATFDIVSATDNQLVITITAVVGNQADTMGFGSNFLSANSSARQADSDNNRLSDDESVKITVSYVDPNNSLISLKVKEFGAYWGNQSVETTVFTDANANVYDLVAFDHTDPETLIDYSTTGLDALTMGNTAIWSLTASASDALGTTKSGMGAFELEYEVIPEPATFGLVGLAGVALIAVRRRFRD